MNIQAITTDTCIVRNTAAAPGRSIAVEPGRTAARHLRYGRIIMDAGDGALRVDTGDRETSFIGLKGSAQVKAEGGTYTVGRYDALYVPRDASVEVIAGPDGCDLAEISSPVTKRHPVQYVAFSDVQKDPGLHFATGGTNSSAASPATSPTAVVFEQMTGQPAAIASRIGIPNPSWSDGNTIAVAAW